MFQHRRSEYMLIGVALLIMLAFSICYAVPGQLGTFLYITTSFFFLAGISIIAFGCLQFYNMFRNN